MTWAGIFSFFQSLKKMLDLITQIVAVVRRIDTQKFNDGVDRVTSKMKHAKNDEDRKNALRDLADLID